MSFNRTILMGNLTHDPEYKQLPSGQAVCRLRVASNRQFKNRQTGSMTQEVLYIDVQVWGAQAESCRQYLQKGRRVLVEGRLKLESWQDQAGQTRSKHSIIADRVVFLGSSQQDEDATSDVSYDSLDAKGQEVMDQVEQMKAKVASRAAAAGAGVRAAKKVSSGNESSASGEMAFHDTPPFEEELPF
jgi:single-strand DNA-binding protein